MVVSWAMSTVVVLLMQMIFLLISASVMQLQKMLDLFSSHGGEIDIHFNPTKSHLLKVGKSFNDCVVDLHIDSTATKWVDSLISVFI